MRIKFKRDTSFRKQFFVPDSFAHPAKMDAQLLIWIVERYTQAGETILDPMAGSGTSMLACTLGRNIILVELEYKFCMMMWDNWYQVKMRPQLGSTMGECKIIQGDARQLEGYVDKIVTSPPFGEAKQGLGELPPDSWFEEKAKKLKRGSQSVEAYKKDWLIQRQRYIEAQGSPNNIGNLPYGEIDKCIFSPPYAESDISQTHMTSDKRGDKDNPNYRPSWGRKLKEGYAETRRPYGQIDKIVTSPPYANRLANEDREKTGGIMGREFEKGNIDFVERWRYSQSKENIGNLKSSSYLEAMLQVYQQCQKVLREGGLMILVTKNFIRNKQIVRLDEDTIKLCEQAGFSFVERHYRELPSQSFWRVIYHQKHPEVEQIKNEDVLVFKKCLN